MEDEGGRRRPSQGFPIVSLSDVAAILREAGKYGTEHQRSAFAHYMGHATTNSGAFKARLAAFRDFGVIETGGERIAMTELGKRIALPPDPAQELDDLRAAFRACKPFAELYDACAKGQPLDAATIANNAVHRLRIAPNSKDRFSASFIKSVVAAGLGREVAAGRVSLGESSTAQAPDVAAQPQPEGPTIAFVPAPAGSDAAISLPWSLPSGRVTFEVRVAEPLTAEAFAKLADVTAAIESLVEVLRDSTEAAIDRLPKPEQAS